MQIIQRAINLILFLTFPILGESQCGVAPVNLGPDTTLCTGQSIVLTAGPVGLYDYYKWNDNSTLNTKTVTAAGTYSVMGAVLDSNIIENGDFELGDTLFNTNYVPGTGGTWGLLSNPGQYTITTSPNLAHNNFFSCADHTPAPGTKMLVVNGASVAGVDVWCQTVPVTPNTNYQLSVWVSNALNELTVAQLQFSINGILTGPVFTTSTLGCNWQQFFQVWNSGTNTTANLCILNQNISGGGNDFMLDDITFRSQCESNDTIVINYAPNPIVNLGPNQNICYGNLTTLDAQNPGATYLWGDSSTNSTLVVDTTGNYSVTVTNANFCSTSDQILVNFEIPKTAGADSSETWCITNPNENLNLYLSPTANSGGMWSDPNGTMGTNLTNTGNLTIAGIPGAHTARYVVYGTHCPNDTSVLNFMIHPQPSGIAPSVLSFCNTMGTTQDLSPYVQGTTADLPPFWVENSVNPSNQFSASTGILDLSSLAGGNYVFYHVLPAQAPCLNDTTQVSVQITEHPIIDFEADFYKGCTPLAVNFTNTSTYSPNSSITWTLPDGTISNQVNGFSHVFVDPICYDVNLMIVANNMCVSDSTITNMICVDPLPVADFKADYQLVFSDDPTVNFTNQSVLNSQNFWDFGDNSSSIAIHPTHQFPLGEVGNYEVILMVVSSEGCMDTTFQIIEVRDQLLFYVPNAFTPDDDEFNNVFLPILTTGFDPNSYRMIIFDRWGHTVFETRDLKIGWDGTFDQYKVASGVYGWKIEFKDEKTDERIIKTGHVNVLY